ncbi:MAG: hypothetical protein M3253_04915 [Chloroflexota bacterium]|nr:hypothetical protein [Chloroflexota bacterium]
MSRGHQSRRRRSYGRRQHELRQRRDTLPSDDRFHHLLLNEPATAERVRSIVEPHEGRAGS